MIQRAGSSKVERICRHFGADDVAMNTTKRSVTTATKPMSESLIQIKDPNTKVKPTPITIKRSQNTQPTRDKTKVRRIENIVSFFRIPLVTVESARNVKAKREKPKTKLKSECERINAVMLTPPIQITATVRSAFLYEGRKNMEE